MIKLFFLFLIFLFSCDDNSRKADVIATDNTIMPVVVIGPIISDDPVIIPDDPPIIGTNIILTFSTGESVKFFDGSMIREWKTGKSISAGFRQLLNGDKFYALDQYGRTVSEKFITGVFDFAVTDELDLWQAINITPEESAAGGALPIYHTKILKNNIEYGDWTTREYKAIDFIIAGTDIMAYGDSGGWRHINGSKTNIRTAVKNGFTIYDFNSTLRIAKIDGVEISWTTNYFNSANFWIKSGSKWYSQNGYIWDGLTLDENTSALKVWRVRANYPISLPENAVLISAGSAVEAEEEVLFFIECNSGWIFKYIPSTNTLEQEVRIYTGDGMRNTGLYYAQILKPVVTGEAIYFLFDDGGIYRYKFDTGLTGFLNFGEWMIGW